MKKEKIDLIQLKPGDYLIRTSSPGDALFIIKTGQLKVLKVDPYGKNILIAVVGPGQFVGETAVLRNTNHKSDVIALTPVTAIRLSKETIHLQLQQAPGWLVTLTKGLIERLRNSNHLLAKNGWINEQLASEITKIAEEQYLASKADSTDGTKKAS